MKHPVLLSFDAIVLCDEPRVSSGFQLRRGSARSLARAPVVLLNLVFDVGQFVLQVLTPVPFFQICWILQTGKNKRTSVLAAEVCGERGPIATPGFHFY